MQYLLYLQNIFASGTIIPQGLYPYSATDLNGCTIYDTILINQPDSLHPSFIVSDYNGYSVSCDGGQDANVEMIINGGSAPYNAQFSSLLNLAVQNELDTTNVPLLLAGSYNYTIIDTNGCVFSDSILLTEPPRLSSITQLINNVSCFDAILINPHTKTHVLVKIEIKDCTLRNVRVGISLTTLESYKYKR